MQLFLDPAEYLKALSAEETAYLLAGRGMGAARAAELNQVWRGLELAVVLQLPLANAAIVTASLSRDLFPGQAARASERNLALSSGIASLLLAPFGAMPMPLSTSISWPTPTSIPSMVNGARGVIAPYTMTIRLTDFAESRLRGH